MNFSRISALIFCVALLVPLRCIAQDSEFEKLKSAASQKLFAEFLDGYLCLSRKQKREMIQLLDKHWKPRFNSASGELFWAGYNSILECVDSLDRENVQTILSEEQWVQFEQLPTKGLNQSTQLNYLRKPEVHDADPIEDCLKVAAGLEIKRLEELLGLNEDQLKILRVASKGSITSVLKQRKDLQKKLAQGANLLFGWVPIAVEGPAFRIRNSAIWNTTLNKILTEEQTDVLRQDRQAAFADSARSSAHSLAISYFSPAPLQAEEYKKFTNLIFDAIEAASEANEIAAENSLPFEVVAIFVLLDDEAIKNTLSDQKWKTIEPILRSVREAFPNETNDEEVKRR